MFNKARMLLAPALCLPALLSAQPACIEPAASAFKTTTIVAPSTSGGVFESQSGPSGPVQMSVASDGRIFVAMMRTGEVRVYNPSTKAVTLSGTIPTFFRTEDGLLGIALDPKFETNNWIYAFFSDPATSGPNRACELARYTVNSSNQITSKKVILRFPRDPSENSHAAGGLAFSSNGVLVIGTGDNTSPGDATNKGFGPVNEAVSTGNAQRTSSNSNDLRGKVLRIKPISFPDNTNPAAGIGTTYEIPPGNLHEVISKMPNWKGENLALVRKEILSMGHRNPYHPRIDTRTGWVFFGEVGPDADNADAARGPAGHDEWNLVKSPGFYGHPYCNGNNLAYGAYPNYTSKYNCAIPVNNSASNTGIKNLPPSVPPVFSYADSDNDSRFGNSGGETGIGSPMYRYNTSSTTVGRLPPYYEGKVLYFDWARRTLRWITLSDSGALTNVKAFAPPGLPTSSYIDAEFGPTGSNEGSIYLLKFSDNGYSIGGGPAIYKVEFTGTYDNDCYKPFGPNVVGIQTPPSLRRVAVLRGNAYVTLPVGYRSVELYDANGRVKWSYRRENAVHAFQAKLPASVSKGVWQARLLP